MKKFVKKISVLLISVLMIVMCSACKKKENKTVSSVKFYTGEVQALSSGTVAENDDYVLEWDAENTALLLRSINTGNTWCTIPYKFYKNNSGSGVASVSLTSPLNISFTEPETLNVKTLSGTTGVLKQGRVASEKIDGGIRITYYFDKIGVSIPVEYILVDGGLEAKVMVNEIAESEYPICQISLLPYMVSAVNQKNSYLVVPSGCGGIIYTDNSALPKTYSEPLYGEDPVRASFADTSHIEESRLPIFGAVDGENSILAVVGKGADAVTIEANAGDPEIGYSGVYASFMLRGYDLTSVTDHAGQEKYFKKYSETRISADYMSVSYYPMENYSSDYSGMSALYRDILEKSISLKKTENDAPCIAIDVLGAAQSNELFLGFPYRSLNVATTVTMAEEIVKELNDELDSEILVKLSGFTGNGLDPGKLGGGFNLAGNIGTKKQLLSLISYCEKKGNPLFMDFDLMRYTQSGKGFSAVTDSVQTANLIRRTFQSFNIATNDSDKNSPKYYLLSPSRFADAGRKLISATDKLGLPGVSLSTLGSMTYSDYAYGKYHCKGGNEEEISSVFKAVRKKGLGIVTSDANLYAAIYSDYVTNSPTKSSQYDCIDQDIPLYQMVLKGLVPLYTAPLNVTDNSKYEFLKAVECGIGLTYSICSEVSQKLILSTHSDFSASRYESVKSEILSRAKDYSDYFSVVSGQKIISHQKNGSLTHTMYENGIEVYVNFGASAVNTPLGIVDGGWFTYGREEA